MRQSAENETVSIHAPNEGSDLGQKRIKLRQLVSIHAPNEGSDHDVVNLYAQEIVSIHAPNEGSDAGSRLLPTKTPSFNPRSQ